MQSIMKDFIGQIQIKVNDKIYLKDPNSSALGIKIIETSIPMIEQIGLEGFTFRKLAKELNTTESSVYRYFESKNKLLIYLISYYWSWLEYQLVFATTNVDAPEEKLIQSIKILAKDIEKGKVHDHINLHLLSRIVISESSKSYLTKEVDAANKTGFYAGYKRLVARISEIVLEIEPTYPFPNSLISTIAEGIHHQKYFAEHLPSLTDGKNSKTQLAKFYSDMALATIKNNG